MERQDPKTKTAQHIKNSTAVPTYVQTHLADVHAGFIQHSRGVGFSCAKKMGGGGGVSAH